MDLWNLVDSAFDGHFVYTPDITRLFLFWREHALYSLSKDGISLPEVYMDLDVPNLAHKNYTNYTASPVATVNGRPVEMFLNDIATEVGNGQDPDNNYNSVFPNWATIGNNLSQGGLFSITGIYQGQGTNTLVTFKNGTTRNIKTFATTNYDFKGVTDGNSLYNRFCKGTQPLASSAAASASAFPSSAVSSNTLLPSSAIASSSAVASASAVSSIVEVPYSAVPSQTTVPAPPTFPQPWVIASDKTIACYFPASNKDLAVLSVPNFGPQSDVEFSDIVRECLATSSKLGKKKLIIDLRGNPGGHVFDGYDFFKQLFPSIQPWGTTNFHAFPLFNDLGKLITGKYSNITVAEAHEEGVGGEFGTIFNADTELNQMNQDFGTWEDFYGPVPVHNDLFTNLARYNLSDGYSTLNSSISGYNGLKGIVPKQTFASKDIIMLQDGTCASTCAVFAEFMKTQAQVRSVVMGGRKQIGPMQGVGGVKGANDYALSTIQYNFMPAFNAASPEEQRTLNAKYGDALGAASYAIERCPKDPSDGSSVCHVNIRNNIRKGDTTVTPLQFVYEGADCRLFYTAPMMADQTVVWSTVYNSWWGNGACVQGSTDQPSSDPGVGYILASPNGTTSASGGSVSSSASGTAATAAPSPTQTGAGSSLKIGGVTVVLAAFGFAFMLL